MIKYIDETGNRYGKLVVISKSRRKTRKAFWDCICDCGNNCTIRADRLRSNIATSCGCDTYSKSISTKGLVEGESQFNAFYSSYQSNAKRKEFIFELSKEAFMEIVKKSCYYCGKPPSEIFKKKKLKGVFVYNGVDRKDSTQGYILENCLPCCTDCNYMKSNIPHDVFIDKVKLIYENFKSKMEKNT